MSDSFQFDHQGNKHGITSLKYVYSDLIALHLKLYPRNQAVGSIGLNFKSRAKII